MTAKLSPTVRPAMALMSLLLLLFQPAATVAQPEPPSPSPQDKRLLVVSPKAFHAALDSFVRHKRQQLAVELVSLEMALKAADGVDDPERLKRFLYEQWRVNRLDYVLLVGDADVMPVRFFVFDRKVPPSFYYGFCPSDLYYADLAKPDGTFEDWNQQKADFHGGYFGEIRGEYNKNDPINYDGIDMLPEVAVGRWPVSTPAQALTLARKSIRYELGAERADPGVRRAGLICTAGWIDARPALDRFADRLGSGWSIEKRYYSDAKRPDPTPPPTEAETHKLLNQRVSLLVHVGHGGTQSWEGCLSVKGLERIRNSGWLPVVISIGCSTSDFVNPGPYVPYVDINGEAHKGTNHGEVFSAPPPPPSPYQKGNYLPLCLGKQILRGGPSGAVAYIGSSTGSQPCAMTLLEGFSLALEKHPHPRLGDCWNDAVRHYYQKERLQTLQPSDSWYPPAVFHQPMKFLLFGDPSLRMPHRLDQSESEQPRDL